MQIRFLYSDSICKSPYVASLKMVFTYSNAPTSCRRWQMAQTHFFLHIGDTAQNSWSEKRHKKWLLQLQCGAYFFIRAIEYFENSKQFYPLFLSNAFHKTNWKFYFDLIYNCNPKIPFHGRWLKFLKNCNQGFK